MLSRRIFINPINAIRRFTYSLDRTTPSFPLDRGKSPPDKGGRRGRTGFICYTLYGFLIGLQSATGLPVGIFGDYFTDVIRVSEGNHCFSNTGIVPMVAG